MAFNSSAGLETMPTFNISIAVKKQTNEDVQKNTREEWIRKIWT